MSEQRDLFGAPIASPAAPSASARRAPVRSRAPVAPPAPTTAPAAPPSAPAATVDRAPEPVEFWEHFGLTREAWSAAVERIERAPRVPGAEHTAWMLAPDPPGVAEARRLARASTAPATHAAVPGGISACEPDPVDPADLRTCSCGLTVHRASLASHLAAAERGVSWSLHLAHLAEAAC